MKTKLSGLLISCTLLINAHLFATQPQNVVTPRSALSVDRARPGDRFEAAVVLDIADGYHINANKPTEDFLIGTELKLEAAAEFQLAPIVYPQPEMHTYPYSPNKPLAVYEKRAVIKVPLTTKRTVKPGKYSLKGKLRYQPCSAQLCLPPKQADIEIPIEVVAAGQSVKRINADIFGSGAGSKQPAKR
jgi:hypothetical protein